MSTRYVWDKYDAIYGNKQTEEKTEYSIDLNSGEYDGAFYFSTGIKMAADGSYTLTGNVLNAISASHAETYVYTSASTYRYGAKYKTGNTSYIENTETSSAYWCFSVSSPGGYKYVGKAVLRQDAASFGAQYSFSTYKLSIIKGPAKIGTLSSANNNAYPQNGVSGSNWYVYKGSDSIDPLSVAYSTDRPERGEAVTVFVEPRKTEGSAPRWAVSSLPASSTWDDVAYGEGRFLAVGYGSIARSMDNGKTWSSVTQQAINDARSIAYGNGVFVAAGFGEAAFSTDSGTTWTESEVPKGNWSAICYGGGKFVAIDTASGSSRAIYSADSGKTWRETTISSGLVMLSICYGNGKFVVVGNQEEGDGFSACSTDGVTWNVYQIKRPAGTNVTGYWRDVAFGDGRFVSVNSSGQSAYSADGENWTGVTMPGDGTWSGRDWTGIAYGSKKFVAMAENSEVSAYSEDGGVSWIEMALPRSITWPKIAYGDGGFVAISSTGNISVYLPDETSVGYEVSYLYQYSVDGGRTWTTTGDITIETQLDIIVPESAEQFMARVRAQDDIGFTSADYVTGANLEVQTMRLWVGVDGAARRGRKLWVGVDGAARPVTRAWVGDENGKARRWF